MDTHTGVFFMAQTRAQIVTDLKNLIGPANEVDDSGLNVWVNDAYMQLIDEIIKVNPDYFTKSATASTVDDQQEYDLPSDFEKMLMLNVSYDNGSTWSRALPMGNADIRHVPVHARETTSQQGFSEGAPQYYIYKDNLGLMPIPDESGSNNVKIWYVYTPSTLTADSSQPDIPGRYHYIIKYGAYANYLDQDDEHVAAERMRQRFDAYILSMIENMQDRQVDEPKSVTITQNRDLYTSGRTHI